MDGFGNRQEGQFEFELNIDDKEFGTGREDTNIGYKSRDDPPINLFDIDMKYQSVDVTEDDNDDDENFTKNETAPAIEIFESSSNDIVIQDDSGDVTCDSKGDVIDFNASEIKSRDAGNFPVENSSKLVNNTEANEVERSEENTEIKIEQSHVDVGLPVKTPLLDHAGGITECCGIEEEKNNEPISQQDLVEEENTISLEDILVKSKRAQEEEDGDEFDFDINTPPPSVSQNQTKIKASPAPLLPTLQSSTSKSTVPQSESSSMGSIQAVPSKPKMPISQTTQSGSLQIDVDKQSQNTGAESVVISSQASPAAGDNNGIFGAVPVQNTKAQSEWDSVQTIEPSFADENEASRGSVPATAAPMLSYFEFNEHLSSQDYTGVKGNIMTSVNRHGFSALKHFLFGPPKIHRNLQDDRDRIFCIASTPLTNENQLHIRALQTIYRCLTGSRFDCGRYGSHWEEIGFQGNDPSTDLRGAGLLGLLNLIHMLRDPKKQALALDIYKLSLHPTQNFPFCVMGINMSRITLQALREDCLNRECNRRGEVSEVVNDFYTGIYLQMYQVWKLQGKTIKDSGYVIKDIESNAKKNPKSVFKTLDEYLAKKKSAVNLDSMDVGGDNFLNVVETDAGQY